MLSEVLLRKHLASNQNFVTDLANDLYYLLIFIYGFLLAPNEQVTRTINQLNQFLLISVGTYFICWILYEVIRRFRLLSLLFGLKVTFSTTVRELRSSPWNVGS